MSDELGALRRRVEELEMKLAFSERTLEALDGVVRELSAKLDASERRVERLEGRIDSPPPDEDGQMPSWA